MNEEIKEAIMVAQSSSVLGALIFVMSPYKPKLIEIFASCFFSAISAPVFYHVLVIDGMSNFKAGVIAAIGGSASSFIFAGLAKLLFAFRKDPMKMAREFKK